MTETECIFPHDFFVASASLPFPPAEFAHYQQFLWRDCHLYDPHATSALAPSNVLSANLYNNSTVLQQQQRPVLDDLFIQTQDFGAAPAAPQQYLQQQLYQQLQLQQLLVQAPTQQRSPSPNQWNVPSPDSDCSEDSPCIPLIEQDESSFFLYDTLKAEPAVPQVFSPDSMESRSTSASASPQKRRYRKRRHAETESASSGEEGSPSPNPDGVQLKRTKGCQKVVWTAALQATFLEAIEELGIGAMPIQLKTRMNVPGLTVRNIASHLHKYRLRLDANAKNAGASQTTVRSASPVDALAAASSPSRPISPTPPLSPNSSGSPNTPSTTEQK